MPRLTAVPTVVAVRAIRALRWRRHTARVDCEAKNIGYDEQHDVAGPTDSHEVAVAAVLPAVGPARDCNLGTELG